MPSEDYESHASTLRIFGRTHLDQFTPLSWNPAGEVVGCAPSEHIRTLCVKSLSLPLSHVTFTCESRESVTIEKGKTNALLCHRGAAEVGPPHTPDPSARRHVSAWQTSAPAPAGSTIFQQCAECTAQSPRQSSPSHAATWCPHRPICGTSQRPATVQLHHIASFYPSLPRPQRP